MQDLPRVSIVFGALRSGSTVFRLMLAQHPRLCAPGESDFLFDYLTDDGQGGLVLDVDGLNRDRIKNEHLGPVTGGMDPIDTVRAMIRDLAQGNDHIVLILHRGVTRAMQMFPDALVIHLLRDPRDVARSCIGMGWAGTAWHGLGSWLGTEREWDTVAATLAPAQVHDLSYERLILDPEAELSAVCAFLNVPYDQAMLRYDSGTTYSRPDPSLTYQWRRKMSQRDLELVEGRLGDMLATRGYAPSGVTPAQPGLGERIALEWRNKRGRWAHAIGRYGVMDPVLLALGQRLRIAPLRHYAQARIDRKLVKYLK